MGVVFSRKHSSAPDQHCMQQDSACPHPPDQKRAGNSGAPWVSLEARSARSWTRTRRTFRGRRFLFNVFSHSHAKVKTRWGWGEDGGLCSLDGWYNHRDECGVACYGTENSFSFPSSRNLFWKDSCGTDTDRFEVGSMFQQWRSVCACSDCCTSLQAS